MRKPYWREDRKQWWVHVRLPNGRSSKRKLHEDEREAYRVWQAMIDQSRQAGDPQMLVSTLASRFLTEMEVLCNLDNDELDLAAEVLMRAQPLIEQLSNESAEGTFSNFALRLGDALHKANRLDEAETWIRICLPYRSGIYGDNARAVLGAVLTSKKEFEAAEKLLLDAVHGLMENADVTQQYIVAHGITCLIELYKQNGNDEAHEKWSRKLEEIQSASGTNC